VLNVRQLAAFVAVYEEGSFSKAAKRTNATQSGLSMQNQQLEEQIGLKLFQRSPRGVAPTVAGRRIYELAVALLRQLDEVGAEIKSMSSGVTGEIKVGLMPTFTRGVLAPALAGYISEFPNVKVSVVEAYSAVLTDGVAAGSLDFAIVPRAPRRDGIRTRWLGTDRELLVCRAGGPLTHLQPVCLSELPALKLVLPGRGNMRRNSFDNYAELHGLKISALLDMDAMIATLDFVAHSEFATILPETICVNDLDGAVRSLHPIVGPALTVDYAVIEPAKSILPRAASLFLERIELQYRKLKQVWEGIHQSAAPADV
jgi:LysR family transcriptional regulator, nitrogen assimilation regulatory protein